MSTNDADTIAVNEVEDFHDSDIMSENDADTIAVDEVEDFHDSDIMPENDADAIAVVEVEDSQDSGAVQFASVLHEDQNGVKWYLLYFYEFHRPQGSHY